MNKLCCIPCNEPPEIRVHVTCTCCASSHVENAKHITDADTVDAESINTTLIKRVCKSGCCCQCKKLRKRRKVKQTSCNISEENASNTSSNSRE